MLSRLRLKLISIWRSGSNNRIAIISLVLILTFAAGDFFGQNRVRTPIDEALSKLVSKGTKNVSKEILQRAAIDGLLKASGDQWANYFPQSAVKTFQQTLQGRYSGIGIWLRRNASGLLEVSSVLKGSPAASVGIKPLDNLLEVNGVSMDGASVATAVASLRGSSNSQVQLQLGRNQKVYRVQVQRESVLTGNVSANQIASGIAYIQVDAINSAAVSDVQIAIKKYKSKLKVTDEIHT